MKGTRFVTTGVLFALLVLVLGRLSQREYSWSSWRAATCLPDGCFCEAIRDDTVKQPMNAWSGLAFVLVGMLVVVQARFDTAGPRGAARSPMRRELAYGGLFGLATMVTGLGTAFFHASLTFAGQIFDIAGMDLLATFILLYNLSRLGRLSPRGFAAAYVIGNVALVLVATAVPSVRRYVFALLLLGALGIEAFAWKRADARSRKIVVAVATSFAVAWSIWVLDITGVLCNPQSMVQGHAIWHVLGAVASGLLYVYYRGETSSP